MTTAILTSTDGFDLSALRFASRAEAAATLGVSEVTIWRWMRDGHLSAGAAGRTGMQVSVEDYPIERLVYPIHTGEDWLDRTAEDQAQRFGLRRFQQLASEADAAIEALP